MQVQTAPSIPVPEKVFINFPFSLEKNKTENFSAKEFPRITGLQTRKHKEVILELISNLELHKDLPVCCWNMQVIMSGR